MKTITRDINSTKKMFNELKKSKNLTRKQLNDLINQNNTDIEILTFYLENMKKIDKIEFYENLIEMYPILPIKICEQFNINKIISEKDKFYNLYNTICMNNDIKEIIENELDTFPKELKILNLNENEKSKLDGKILVIKL